MALAYHKPAALQENTGIVTKKQESDYYASLIRQMDIDINKKNGTFVEQTASTKKKAITHG